MIDVYYDTEKPLSSDIDILCDTLGVESEEDRRAVERLLRLKFEKTEEGYRHRRCDEEIAAYHSRADIAKTNGKRGGRPKKPSPNPKKPSGFPSGSDPVPTGFPSGSDPVPSGFPSGSDPVRVGVPNPNPDITGSKANQEPRTKNQEKEREGTAQAPSLPDWIPLDAWNGWLEMRRKIRKPATDRAITLAVAQLAKLRDQGHSPEAVLDRSTVNDWTGLFPVPAEGGRGGAQVRLSGGFVA
jgi:hypothetical protein